MIITRRVFDGGASAAIFGAGLDPASRVSVFTEGIFLPGRARRAGAGCLVVQGDLEWRLSAPLSEMTALFPAQVAAVGAALEALAGAGSGLLAIDIYTSAAVGLTRSLSCHRAGAPQAKIAAPLRPLLARFGDVCLLALPSEAHDVRVMACHELAWEAARDGTRRSDVAGPRAGLPGGVPLAAVGQPAPAGIAAAA